MEIEHFTKTTNIKILSINFRARKGSNDAIHQIFVNPLIDENPKARLNYYRRKVSTTSSDFSYASYRAWMYWAEGTKVKQRNKRNIISAIASISEGTERKNIYLLLRRISHYAFSHLFFGISQVNRSSHLRGFFAKVDSHFKVVFVLNSLGNKSNLNFFEAVKKSLLKLLFLQKAWQLILFL